MDTTERSRTARVEPGSGPNYPPPCGHQPIQVVTAHTAQSQGPHLISNARAPAPCRAMARRRLGRAGTVASQKRGRALGGRERRLRSSPAGIEWPRTAHTLEAALRGRDDSAPKPAGRDMAAADRDRAHPNLSAPVSAAHGPSARSLQAVGGVARSAHTTRALSSRGAHHPYRGAESGNVSKSSPDGPAPGRHPRRRRYLVAGRWHLRRLHDIVS